MSRSCEAGRVCGKSSWTSAVSGFGAQTRWVGPSEEAHAGLDESSLACLIWRKRCPGCSRHVSLMSGRAKRDLCREICLTLKLQMETHSHQLLMEATESLGDDSHEQ